MDVWNVQNWNVPSGNVRAQRVRAQKRTMTKQTNGAKVVWTKDRCQALEVNVNSDGAGPDGYGTVRRKLMKLKTVGGEVKVRRSLLMVAGMVVHQCAEAL